LNISDITYIDLDISLNSINDKTPIPDTKGDSSVTKVTKEAEEDLDSDDLEFEEFDYRIVGTHTRLNMYNLWLLVNYYGLGKWKIHKNHH